MHLFYYAATDSAAGLNEADQVTQLSLSSGFTVPIEAEQVLKPAAMSCATKYFGDDEKEGLALLTAMLQKSTRAKKPNAMLAEMPRAYVTRWMNISSEELGIIL